MFHYIFLCGVPGRRVRGSVVSIYLPADEFQTELSLNSLILMEGLISKKCRVRFDGGLTANIVLG